MTPDTDVIEVNFVIEHTVRIFVFRNQQINSGI